MTEKEIDYEKKWSEATTKELIMDFSKLTNDELLHVKKPYQIPEKEYNDECLKRYYKYMRKIDEDLLNARCIISEIERDMWLTNKLNYGHGDSPERDMIMVIKSQLMVINRSISFLTSLHPKPKE